jgi:hypothetical protein
MFGANITFPMQFQLTQTWVAVYERSGENILRVDILGPILGNELKMRAIPAWTGIIVF